MPDQQPLLSDMFDEPVHLEDGTMADLVHDEGEEEEERTGAPGGAPSTPKHKQAAVLEVPCVTQKTGFGCGAACADSVARYYGINKSLDEWTKLLGTNVHTSTQPDAIVKALESLGLNPEPSDDLEIEDLNEYVAIGWPVIVCVQDYGRCEKGADYQYGHYLVVCGVVPGPNTYVICQDPSEDNVIKKGSDSIQAPGKILIGAEEFLKNWHDETEDGKKLVRYGIAVGG